MPDTKHRNAHVEDVSEIKKDEASRPAHKHHFSSKKDKIAWYLDEIDCYKEDMGKWYTIFIRRILPILVFFFPINNLSFGLCEYLVKHVLGGVITFDNTTFPLVVFFVALLIFVLILIFLPRFATFCEFALGIAFYTLVVVRLNQFNNGVIYKPLITNGRGDFVAIALGIFLFMKLVFLVIEIIYMITFRGEHEPRVYKEESDNDVVF